LAATVQQLVYVNTADTPEECYADARTFFAVINVRDNLAKFNTASVKINTEGHGDGKPWRGHFVYSK
jgi:hypothetical protein